MLIQRFEPQRRRLQIPINIIIIIIIIIIHSNPQLKLYSIITMHAANPRRLKSE